MVADQGVHIAAGPAGLRLQLHQQVHDPARIGRPVRHIAHLHQVGFAAAPVVVGVHQSGLDEHVVKFGVVTMEIAEHHDTRDVVPGRLRRPRRQAGPQSEGDQNKRQNPSHGRQHTTVADGRRVRSKIPRALHGLLAKPHRLGQGNPMGSMR